MTSAAKQTSSWIGGLAAGLILSFVGSYIAWGRTAIDREEVRIMIAEYVRGATASEAVYRDMMSEWRQRWEEQMQGLRNDVQQLDRRLAEISVHLDMLRQSPPAKP